MAAWPELLSGAGTAAGGFALSTIVRAFNQHRTQERADEATETARREAEARAFQERITKALEDTQDLLHRLDTRLAQVEAVQKDRNYST